MGFLTKSYFTVTQSFPRARGHAARNDRSSPVAATELSNAGCRDAGKGDTGATEDVQNC
jgi:hypothetical protein